MCPERVEVQKQMFIKGAKLLIEVRQVANVRNSSRVLGASGTRQITQNV